ncbi:MAG TPA: hypothetical protein VGA03_13715 [Anaerolineales bacterium]
MDFLLIVFCDNMNGLGKHDLASRAFPDGILLEGKKEEAKASKALIPVNQIVPSTTIKETGLFQLRMAQFGEFR